MRDFFVKAVWVEWTECRDCGCCCASCDIVDAVPANVYALAAIVQWLDILFMRCCMVSFLHFSKLWIASCQDRYTLPHSEHAKQNFKSNKRAFFFSSTEHAN